MTTRTLIPVAAPMLVGNEKAYVNDCLDSAWVSSVGGYIKEFEAAFAEFCGVRHAISCCNGTAALHLALMALGVRQGDEVIIPTLTFVATANAVSYCGAVPVFVDSEADTWNIDPSFIESRIGPRTRGIIAVHLYGHPADMEPILSIARRHGLFVIEDAAEAHGAEYRGLRAGSIGDINAFSFFGNKILTTGEGGMVTTNNDSLAEKALQLRGHGVDPARQYWFPVIGYNYRMTNIAAAIGLAQVEKADWHLHRRIEIANWYKEELASVCGVSYQCEVAWAKHAHWMFSVLLDDATHSQQRDAVMEYMKRQGVETRPVFYPIHTLPPYRHLSLDSRFPVAERIAGSGITLPTWNGLTQEDVRFVCQTLATAIAECHIASKEVAVY